MVGQTLRAILGVGDSRHAMGVQVRKVLKAEGIIDLENAAARAHEDSAISAWGVGLCGTKPLPLHHGEIEELA